MEITHTLKDGTVVSDITGHVVKMEDARRAYEIMKAMKGKKK